jgi:hypothetical protein
MKLKDLQVGDRFYYAAPFNGKPDTAPRRITEIKEHGTIWYEREDGATSPWFFGTGSRWHEKEVVLLPPLTTPEDV